MQMQDIIGAGTFLGLTAVSVLLTWFVIDKPDESSASSNSVVSECKAHHRKKGVDVPVFGDHRIEARGSDTFVVIKTEGDYRHCYINKSGDVWKSN